MGDLDTTVRAALSEETKERIRTEEQYRLQVRADLNRKQDDDMGDKKPDGVVSFLNSKLGLLFLGSLIVPALGGLYTHIQHRANDRTTDNRQMLKLATEFDWRLAEIEYQKDRIPGETNTDKWASAAYIWRAIVGDTAFATTTPDFQRVHLAGIVSQLRSLGYDDPNDLAFKTIKEMETGGQKVRLPNQPPLQSSTYDVNFLNSQLKILRAFRSRVVPKSGFWNLLL